MNNGNPILVEKLSRRNAASAQEALRALDARISELCSINQTQQQGLSAMMQRIQELEGKYMLQKVQLTGTGPSVE